MTTTITEFFEQDHREIDALVEGLTYDSPRALARFERFDARLERHIQWEESLLFPAAARHAPQLQAGPIGVMLAEHQRIRELKEVVLDALRRGDAKTAAESARRLFVILSDHNFKEERILYPACDGCLGAAERAALLAEIGAGGGRAPKEGGPVTLELTVNEVADRYPATRAVLARYGVDLCCGGVHPVGMAARAHGVDAEELLGELNAAAASGL